jgi:sensor histidine kinase YesM
MNLKEYKYLVVEDNGVGMNKEETKNLIIDNAVRSHSTGIGINNVKKRLELFYNSNDIMFIESEIGIGTKVYIKLLEN